MNPEGDFNRKRLTRFLCQELLYEFVTHNLDGHREKEVTDYLATCRDSQRELDNLNKGLRFCMKASQTRITPAFYHALENFEPQWQKQLRAWTISGTQKGWRMLPYIFAVLVIAVGILAVKPWVQKANEDVLLAEQLKKEPDMLPPAREASPAPPPPTATLAAAPAAQPPAAPPPLALPQEESVAQTPASAPSAQAQSPAADPASGPAVQGFDGSNETEAMGRGFLHRATIDVRDFQNSWPAIRDKIVALGGKVAGNVELGWLRRPTEAYFHFTLPESNLRELEIFLGTFSPVQFSKERHPRVMPEGQIRIIMSVKDGMTTHEGSPETP